MHSGFVTCHNQLSSFLLIFILQANLPLAIVSGRAGEDKGLLLVFMSLLNFMFCSAG